MIYDSLDFHILYEIINDDTTTWEITKKFFKNEHTNSKHILVKTRLKRMSDVGLVIITKDITENGNGKLKYLLVKDNVIFCKHKFPNGYNNSILIKEYGKWCAFQL